MARGLDYFSDTSIVPQKASTTCRRPYMSYGFRFIGVSDIREIVVEKTLSDRRSIWRRELRERDGLRRWRAIFDGARMPHQQEYNSRHLLMSDSRHNDDRQ